MRVSEHVYMLEVGTIYPTLLTDGKEFVLVDAAYPMQFNELQEAINKEGFLVEQLTKIILTHQDIDHIGCIKECLEKNPAIKVYAHYQETPYIDGRKTPIKLFNLENIYNSLDESGRAIYQRMKAGFDNRRIKIDYELSDYEVLPICGTIEIIPTPGHTPGHISLYIKEDAVLISGDALNKKDDQLSGPNPEYTQDMDLALKSLEQLIELPIKYLILYHGGLIEEDISTQISNITKRNSI